MRTLVLSQMCIGMCIDMRIMCIDMRIDSSVQICRHSLGIRYLEMSLDMYVYRYVYPQAGAAIKSVQGLARTESLLTFTPSTCSQAGKLANGCASRCSRVAFGSRREAWRHGDPPCALRGRGSPKLGLVLESPQRGLVLESPQRRARLSRRGS